MPSAKIHEVVAIKMNKKYGMDEVILRLGTIAPDSWRNTPINSKFHDRFLTHFYSANIDKMIKYDYEKFYKKYEAYLDNPFYFGYLLHLMVDCYWKTNIDPIYCSNCDGVIKYRLKNGSYIEDKNYFEYYDNLKLQRCLASLFNLGRLPLYMDDIPSFSCEIDEIDLSGLFGNNGTINYVNNNTIGNIEETSIYDVEKIIVHIDDTCSFISNELARLKRQEFSIKK